MTATGIDNMTYRKGKTGKEPTSSFSEVLYQLSYAPEAQQSHRQRWGTRLRRRIIRCRGRGRKTFAVSQGRPR